MFEFWTIVRFNFYMSIVAQALHRAIGGALEVNNRRVTAQCCGGDRKKGFNVLFRAMSFGVLEGGEFVRVPNNVTSVRICETNDTSLPRAYSLSNNPSVTFIGLLLLLLVHCITSHYCRGALQPFVHHGSLFIEREEP